MMVSLPSTIGDCPTMPQIYIREDQYDEIVELDFDTREESLEFIREAIDAGLKKELRKRKRDQ
jgi:hypothetical protein